MNGEKNYDTVLIVENDSVCIKSDYDIGIPNIFKE